MPTELEELVEFLHHGNTQIRQVAAENLVGYSATQPSLFKRNNLEPVKDLKLLVKDFAPIAHNALTILVNISDDKDVLKNLASDDVFRETLLQRITNPKELNANELSMLFANLAKSDHSIKLLSLQRKSIPKPLSTSPYAITQLLDLFVKSAASSYNPKADFDYLSYFFADMAQHPDARSYFVTEHKQDDNVIPLTKIIVFTEHKSVVRRRGVASTIKNVAFSVDAHGRLLDPREINLLPYVMLPLMGPEEYSDEDTEGMPEECQLLPPDKEREEDVEILKIHLETLLLLTTTKEGREVLREKQVYPVVRECHLRVEDEGVRDACDRVVQVIMRDEPTDREEKGDTDEKAESEKAVKEMDSDEEIVDVI